MIAKDFISNEGGFATCLRNMQTAVEQGVSIDFSNWGESARKLIGLERKTLDALIDLYSEFHGARCKAGQKKSEAAGLRSGRKRLVLPDNFETEVVRWLSGEISSKEAAKNCGMSLTTFYVKAKERQQKFKTPEAVEDAVAQWQQRKITTSDAALKLGITCRAFNIILNTRGVKREYKPKTFERYYELYREGILSKDEAAKLCGISIQHFNCCVKNFAEGQNKKEVTGG